MQNCLQSNRTVNGYDDTNVIQSRDCIHLSANQTQGAEKSYDWVSIKSTKANNIRSMTRDNDRYVRLLDDTTSMTGIFCMIKTCLESKVHSFILRMMWFMSHHVFLFGVINFTRTSDTQRGCKIAVRTHNSEWNILVPW